MQANIPSGKSDPLQSRTSRISLTVLLPLECHRKRPADDPRFESRQGLRIAFLEML
jgi:hypothetical protein